MSPNTETVIKIFFSTPREARGTATDALTPIEPQSELHGLRIRIKDTESEIIPELRPTLWDARQPTWESGQREEKKTRQNCGSQDRLLDIFFTL